MESMSSESIPDIANSFWVARVSSAVFSDNSYVSLKPEFEAVFRVYDEEVQFSYLKSFGRVRVICSTLERASFAQESLKNVEFQGENLRLQPVKPIRIGSATLGLPQRTKQFLISPPSSPPVGWNQTEEASPVLDFSLVTALAKLQLPGDIQELHGGSDTQPSIVIISPEEVKDEELLPTVLRDQHPPPSISSLPPTIVHTARPPINN